MSLAVLGAQYCRVVEHIACCLDSRIEQSNRVDMYTHCSLSPVPPLRNVDADSTSASTSPTHPLWVLPPPASSPDVSATRNLQDSAEEGWSRAGRTCSSHFRIYIHVPVQI